MAPLQKKTFYFTNHKTVALSYHLTYHLQCHSASFLYLSSSLLVCIDLHLVSHTQLEISSIYSVIIEQFGAVTLFRMRKAYL